MYLLIKVTAQVYYRTSSAPSRRATMQVPLLSASDRRNDQTPPRPVLPELATAQLVEPGTARALLAFETKRHSWG